MTLPLAILALTSWAAIDPAVTATPDLSLKYGALEPLPNKTYGGKWWENNGGKLYLVERIARGYAWYDIDITGQAPDAQNPKFPGYYETPPEGRGKAHLSAITDGGNIIAYLERETNRKLSTGFFTINAIKKSAKKEDCRVRLSWPAREKDGFVEGRLTVIAVEGEATFKLRGLATKKSFPRLEIKLRAQGYPAGYNDIEGSFIFTILDKDGNLVKDVFYEIPAKKKGFDMINFSMHEEDFFELFKMTKEEAKKLDGSVTVRGTVDYASMGYTFGDIGKRGSIIMKNETKSSVE